MNAVDRPEWVRVPTVTEWAASCRAALAAGSDQLPAWPPSEFPGWADDVRIDLPTGGQATVTFSSRPIVGDARFPGAAVQVLMVWGVVIAAEDPWEEVGDISAARPTVCISEGYSSDPDEVRALSAAMRSAAEVLQEHSDGER